MRLALLALVLLAPGAAAQVTLSDVQAPAQTVADHAFPLRVDVSNDGPDGRRVYLFAALYEHRDGQGPCGPATDPRFRRFTPLVQASLHVPAGQRVAYPPTGESWLQIYGPGDVAGPEMDLCVFVAEDAAAGSAQIRYLDFEQVMLKTRAANAAPRGDFEWSPSVPEAAQPVAFSATATDAEGDPISYRWDFGHANASGRAVAQGPDVVHRFFPDGDFVVTLTLSDGFDETAHPKPVHVLPEGEGVVEPSTLAAPSETPVPLALTLAAALLAARLSRRSAR